MHIEDSIKELQKVTKRIATLTKQKEELINEIIKSLNHNHAGQKSYEVAEYKLEVKTPSIYSLNKALYESGDIKLPAKYNPIKESKSYSVDKKAYDELIETAPNEVYESLLDLITIKPGKPNITVKYKE